MRSAVSAVWLLVLVAVCNAQTPRQNDISTVTGAGAVSENQYTNSFFKLTIDAPDATLELNPLVNTAGAGQYAHLVKILSKPTNWDNMYTFAVMAEPLAPNPQIESPSQYVRSIRHMLERQGLATVRQEFPITIADVKFSGAVLQDKVPSGRKYYRGIYTTFRYAYILTFDVEAASEDKLNNLLNRLVEMKPD
jgi:hypothetical protein